MLLMLMLILTFTGYPATINHNKQNEFALEVAQKVIGKMPPQTKP